MEQDDEEYYQDDFRYDGGENGSEDLEDEESGEEDRKTR
jgi:hypothetical protein